jgi:class 3 adenylate cyclase/tetratricopeptide (TPR) repeat protein
MDTVLCPSCGEENPSRFRLCGFCGTSLAPPETVSCPSCGEENPGKFRLCGFCGTPLQGAAPATVAAPPAPIAAPTPSLPAAEVRKPATFIFVDLKGSTALTERIDQEAMNEIKKRYFGAMAAQIEHHGGTVEKYIGDAIMAVFGIPRAREDDALRAVRAARGMQHELIRLNAEFLPFYGVELANRTGVNTGEVVANTDPTANQQLATGDTVNVAARLEQAAPPNEILIGETTYDLVRSHVEVEPVEPLELKGKSERVTAYRLLAVREATARGAQLAHRTPLIGRDAEMARIRDAFSAVRADGGGRLVVLVGEAGVGKSRILDDLEGEVGGEATVVRGRCLPYGDGITFWPIVEVVRNAAGIFDDDSPEVARQRISDLLAGSAEREQILERLTSVIGLSPSRFPVAEVFWGTRKFLEVMAAQRPVVVLFEDVHDAEPTFFDLIEHLVETLPSSASVLILAAARLPLLDKRAELGTADRSARIQLAALAEADAGMLVEALFGASVQDELKGRIARATEGNPLFTEQLVSMLVDKGHVRRVDDGWAATADIGALEVPPTIQALLAARLDALSREERATIEPASVIGLVFAQTAVAELVPATLRSSVQVQLAAMDRKQLLQREGGPELEAEGEGEAYRFRNLLIRDATYGSLLKRARAQLHERFVQWAERINRERGREEEFEEILGYHLEQAYRYRTELGPIDAEGRTIGARAAAKLGAAGRRALGRGDIPAAVNLLDRASGLMDTTSPERVDTLTDLSEARLEAGDTDGSRRAVAMAAAAAQELGDERLKARARLRELALDAFYAAEPIPVSEALSGANEAMRVLEQHADTAGLGGAWRLVFFLEGSAGHYDQAAAAAERVVDYAEQANDRRLLGRGVMGYASAASHGTQAIGDVRRHCERLLLRVAGDRHAEATVLAVMAQAAAMDGDQDRARELALRYRSTLEELGPSVTAASTSIETTRIDLLSEDLAAAEAGLRRDYEALGRMDEHYFRATIAGYLAWVVATAGRSEEAVSLSEAAEALAPADGAAEQFLWRVARARAFSTLERMDEAVALARDAVPFVEGDPILLADALSDLATILSAAGQHEEAAATWQRALLIYQAKGDRVSAAHATKQLADAGAIARGSSSSDSSLAGLSLPE